MRQFLSAANAGLVLASSSANSHIHTERDGSTVSWYPQDCCREGDCRPVAKMSTAPRGLWMETVDAQTVLVGLKTSGSLPRTRAGISVFTSTPIYSFSKFAASSSLRMQFRDFTTAVNKKCCGTSQPMLHRHRAPASARYGLGYFRASSVPLGLRSLGGPAD